MVRIAQERAGPLLASTITVVATREPSRPRASTPARGALNAQRRGLARLSGRCNVVPYKPTRLDAPRRYARPTVPMRERSPLRTRPPLRRRRPRLGP